MTLFTRLHISLHPPPPSNLSLSMSLAVCKSACTRQQSLFHLSLPVSTLPPSPPHPPPPLSIRICLHPSAMSLIPKPWVTSSPLPLAASPLRYPLSPPFLFCLVLTWQRRGFCVRSAAAVASTSLPALYDRSVGGTASTPCQTLGWRRLFPNIGGEKRTKPKHWGFPDYYPLKKQG